MNTLNGFQGVYQFFIDFFTWVSRGSSLFKRWIFQDFLRKVMSPLNLCEKIWHYLIKKSNKSLEIHLRFLSRGTSFPILARTPIVLHSKVLFHPLKKFSRKLISPWSYHFFEKKRVIIQNSLKKSDMPLEPM